jgi:hypothetical protein
LEQLKNSKKGRKPCYLCVILSSEHGYTYIKGRRPSEPKRKHMKVLSRGCKTCGLPLCPANFNMYHLKHLKEAPEKYHVHESFWA